MLKELSIVEQRYDAVVAVIRDGLTVTEAAGMGNRDPWPASGVLAPLPTHR